MPSLPPASDERKPVSAPATPFTDEGAPDLTPAENMAPADGKAEQDVAANVKGIFKQVSQKDCLDLRC